MDYRWDVWGTLTFAPCVQKELDATPEKVCQISGPKDWQGAHACFRQNKVPFTAVEFAQKLVRRWVRNLNRSMFTRKQAREGRRLQVFIPWERQKWGALHAHPLVACLPGKEEPRWSRWLMEDISGWRVEELRRAWKHTQAEFGIEPGHAWLKYIGATNEEHRQAVLGYVSKYVAKDSDGDLWDLLGFPRKL